MTVVLEVPVLEFFCSNTSLSFCEISILLNMNLPDY